MQEYLDYLCCPKCKGSLCVSNDCLCCSDCKQQYAFIDGNIPSFISIEDESVVLSVEKWNEMYDRQLLAGSYLDDFSYYKKEYFSDVRSQLEKEKKICAHDALLEIGCGHMFLGQLLAKDVKLIVGIDFCASALKMAKNMLEKQGIKNYLLIQGNILNLPIKRDMVDIIYGGGVIEHFDDTQTCVNELYRVLKKDGISFNTVPYLNLGALTYRQIWGNIPNFPVIKWLAELVHIKILGGRHMIFGYEFSFLESTLRNIHKKAGFREVRLGRFDIKLVFEFVPVGLRKYFIWLAKNSRLFWPMIRVSGKK